MLVNKMKDLANIIINTRQTVCLMGDRGIGKTQSVKKVFSELGYKVVTIRVGRLDDPGELVGMPYIIEQGGASTTTYAPLETLSFTPGEKTLVFFDEVNRCKPQIINGLFEALENPYGQDVLVIAAANPPTDDYNVLDFNDAAFSDRMCFIRVDNNVDVVCDYIGQLNKTYSSFLKKNSEFVGINDGEKWSVYDFIKPSPRSHETVSKFVNNKTDLTDIEFEFVSGLIGISAASKLLDFIKTVKNTYSLDNILEGDIQKVEDVSVTDKILGEIQEKMYVDSSKEEIELINEFLLLVNIDHLIGFFKKISSSDEHLTKVSQQYIENYAKLIEDVETNTYKLHVKLNDSKYGINAA